MDSATAPRELTEIEAAVLRMLKKPAPAATVDIKADFCVRAFSDPLELVQLAFNSVDWALIAMHAER